MYGVLHRGIERAGDSRRIEVITIIGVHNFRFLISDFLFICFLPVWA